jgi:dTDP-4-amino-4,6-dideoxygalactose transaminase
MNKIPFSQPLIDEDVVAEVLDSLVNTGWLTSGPKVQALEAEVRAYTGAQAVVCVNSWTSGAMLALKWFGVGAGDEVIIPAYTYAATALCALNIGARVVMVDVLDDFTLDPEQLERAITPRTRAIIPVDLGGWPADYDRIKSILEDEQVRSRFSPATQAQEKLGRPLILADAAHSIGAHYRGRKSGVCADITVLSFHSVKNITTGEGGAVCLQLPPAFDPEAEYRFMKLYSLNGQSKSTYEKNIPGDWRYDIVEQGLKVNMPDLSAAVGLAQIRKYDRQLLPERFELFRLYLELLGASDRLRLPLLQNGEGTVSSAHLFLLRIDGMTEAGRDRIIADMAREGIGLNVHYIPLPMMTLFRRLGFSMDDYPNTLRLYMNEITLPLYNGLTTDSVRVVCDKLLQYTC